MAEKGRRPLLRWQKNEVFQDVVSEGLIPSEFRWAERPSTKAEGLTVSQLIHQPTGYFFIFDYNPSGGRYGLFSPGDEDLWMGTPSHLVLSAWAQLRQYVLLWLRYLKKEIEVPDMWEAIGEEKKLAEAASSFETPNAPFTPQEQQSLTEKICEIEKYVIETHRLTGEHAEFVKRRLDYLADSGKRLGRFDWVNVAQNVLIGIVLKIAPGQDAIRDLFRFAWALLSPFFGGTPPLQLGA